MADGCFLGLSIGWTWWRIYLPSPFPWIKVLLRGTSIPPVLMGYVYVGASESTMSHVSVSVAKPGDRWWKWGDRHEVKSWWIATPFVWPESIKNGLAQRCGKQVRPKSISKRCCLVHNAYKLPNSSSYALLRFQNKRQTIDSHTCYFKRALFELPMSESPEGRECLLKTYILKTHHRSTKAKSLGMETKMTYLTSSPGNS